MAKEQLKDKPHRKKGFNVGPANLPDGTYRRKVVKIKKSLIHKAKVKKSFAKVVAKDESSTDVHAAQANKYLEEAAVQKSQEEEERARLRKMAKDDGEGEGEGDSEPKAQKMHPERQAALETPAPVEELENRQEGSYRSRPPKKPKTSSFKREEDYAAKIRAEREAQIKEIEERKKIHEQKERERHRRKKVMSARTGKGQQKLGKQGTMLLDKVKAMMGSS